MNRLKYSAFLIALFFSLVLSPINSAQAAKCKKSPHVSHITIKAPPHVVYDSIITLRKSHPKNVRELKKTCNHTLVEETFDLLPVIGRTKCIYKETYIPQKQVSYHLIESPRFKAFEGRWTLTPVNNGRHTKLSLSSYVDPGLNIPFAKQITRMETRKGVKKRLHLVKKKSERKHLAMSSKPRAKTN